MSLQLQQRALLEMIDTGLATSQVELAEKLGLKPTSVNRTIKRLEELGLVFRDGVKRGHMGRPMLTYRTRKLEQVLVIQWFNIEWIAGIFQGRELKQEVIRRESQPIANWEAAVDSLKLIRDEALAQAGLKLGDLQRIVLAINATEASSRHLFISSVMPWLNDKRESDFTRALGVKTKLDLRPHRVLPELRARLDEGVRSLMVFTVEDGVGAHGARVNENWGVLDSYRGELGHVVLDPRGPLCGCGHRGCIEAMISGPALKQKIQADIANGVTTALRNFLHNTPQEIFDELERLSSNGKDAYASMLVDEFLHRVAWSLSVLVNVVGPDVIVVGGYGLEGRPQWFQEIEKRTRLMALVNEKMPMRLEPPRLKHTDYLCELAITQENETKPQQTRKKC